VITFEEARAVVQHSSSVRELWGNSFTTADYGWQNGDVYQVVAYIPDEPDVFDAPMLFVDKQTGELREVYGLVGENPFPDLVPI
jgi:hypothetical protein